MRDPVGSRRDLDVMRLEIFGMKEIVSEYEAREARRTVGSEDPAKLQTEIMILIRH